MTTYELLKPKLSIDEQIQHLKKKGVKFELISEKEALRYLSENNNYFKLRAYRKNFEKYTSGEKADTYINLDFAMLKDLAIIDMRLRYALIEMSLDIEHFEKVKLLTKISNSEDDGYNIVNEYLETLKTELIPGTTTNKYSSLMVEIRRNKDSEYCGDLLEKYSDGYPVWVFVEILPFGSFINFLKFCAEYLDDRELRDDVYLLYDVKRIRNASAHNNCMIYNLQLNTARHRTNYNVNRYLSNELRITKKTRDRRMSNAIVRDIVTLLYTHKTFITSEGVHRARAVSLNDVKARCFKNIDYYAGNDLICATFNFLFKIVDKMFSL